MHTGSAKGGRSLLQTENSDVEVRGYFASNTLLGGVLGHAAKSFMISQVMNRGIYEPLAGKRVLRGSRGHFELFIPSHSRGNTESDKRDLIKKYAPSPELRPFKT